jgi:hypothetical protein
MVRSFLRNGNGRVAPRVSLEEKEEEDGRTRTTSRLVVVVDNESENQPVVGCETSTEGSAEVSFHFHCGTKHFDPLKNWSDRDNHGRRRGESKREVTTAIEFPTGSGQGTGSLGPAAKHPPGGVGAALGSASGAYRFLTSVAVHSDSFFRLRRCRCPAHVFRSWSTTLASGKLR